MTNIAICLGDHVLFGQPVSIEVLLSLVLMVLSAGVTGYTDVEFSSVGYVWLALNCMFTAGYVLAIRGSMLKTHLGELGMTTYNNLVSMPLVLILMYCSNEFKLVFHDPIVHDPQFQTALLVTGVAGFLLSLSIFWCLRQTSPTTYSLVGAVTKVPMSVLGILIFGNPVTTGGLISIAMGLAGGVLYSCAKNNSSPQPSPERTTPISKPLCPGELLLAKVAPVTSA
eukprot:CAMPEP_0184662572 /NCGR_PEP_ID=MMETSP0308-20130426/43861_1 /TAXON_ID=38269 /ORGANISM="Gloeochaete witrockiana, Strain SAG 46.84" /LENGTH=225 /DNA_ID=CAMNT_0027104693 /DNA_START=495 /DNA_END=1172 /DNA_ORIENTATION=-